MLLIIAPGNAGGNRRLGDLRHSRAYGFDQYGVGTLGWILDKTKKLLRLLHGIVAGVDNLHIGSKLDRRRLGRGCLFELVIVIFCN